MTFPHEQLSPPDGAARPDKSSAFVILTIVIVLVVSWTLVGTQFISLSSLLGGFLQLWYWASCEKLEFRRLPASLFGAMVGIGLAWLLIWGGTHHGTLGFGGALALVIVAVYLDILKAMPLVINNATTLFLTIATAPLIQLHVNWVELVLSTAGGAVFFAVLVGVLTRLAGRFVAVG